MCNPQTEFEDWIDTFAELPTREEKKQFFNVPIPLAYLVDIMERMIKAEEKLQNNEDLPKCNVCRIPVDFDEGEGYAVDGVCYCDDHCEDDLDLDDGTHEYEDDSDEEDDEAAEIAREVAEQRKALGL